MPLSALLLMHILVTNDDRYLAPGTRILADALSVINNMSLVTPDCKSGVSNSLSLKRPLQLQKKQQNVEIGADQQIANELMPAESILNIKVSDSTCNLRSFKTTRLRLRHKAKQIKSPTDLYGSSIHAAFPLEEEQDALTGANLYTNQQNQVPVTPFRVNLTRHESIDSLQHC